ncbi:ribonuclease H-like domain-containing protein [Panaeolus papilionaceus]|nr:ribonuclease H-like domain-containing protein [Panaeolus papilionaceus]
MIRALSLPVAPLRSVSLKTRLRTSAGLSVPIKRYINTKPKIPHKNMSTKPMTFHDGPLVWIDCEMTGLDLRKDKIIEIAVLITNGNLDIVDPGIEYVIRTEKELLEGMDEWCTKQHGQSGLTQACLDSPYTREYVSKTVLEYIKKWVPTEKIGVLAGNSVHVDRQFLAVDMPEVIDWLHYRIVDVSSIKASYPKLGAPLSNITFRNFLGVGMRKRASRPKMGKPLTGMTVAPLVINSR